MGQSWENGLWECAGCGGEFEQAELEEALSLESDYDETAPGGYTIHRVSISLCPDCHKQYVEKIARQLLNW
jgi:ribosomal protein L37AE/L43A